MRPIFWGFFIPSSGERVKVDEKRDALGRAIGKVVIQALMSILQSSPLGKLEQG